MSRSLAKWDQRIKRAAELAAAHPFAAEALRFYERLAGFQKSLYASLVHPSGSLRKELDLDFLLPRFPAFLSLIESIAPAPLAQSAAGLKAGGEVRWGRVLEEFWRNGGQDTATLTATEALIAWTFLQPYAEHLADHTEPAETREITPSLCPLCSGRPHVGILRQQGGRWQALTDLLALRDGMGVPAARLSLLRRRERRQASGLYR